MQVNIALLTVTDTRTIENDKSGAILVKKIKEHNHNLIDRKIVKDEKDQIKKILLEWIKKDKDRKSTRLNSSHALISYAVFCLKKKNK